jgi:hypothetical protein
MDTKLVWNTVVDEVTEREMVVCGRKDASGNSVLVVESAGWYIRMGNVSFCVGPDEPSIKKGDLIRVTLEKRKHG